jgi:hypothetical protein
MSTFSGWIVRLPTLAAVVVVAVLSASCAVLTSGTKQTVAVASQPAQAEVFVDGVSAGFTPLELELERGRDHTVVVRWGGQERSVVLRSGTQTVPLVLDLVPVALTGGILVSDYASGALTGMPRELQLVGWAIVAVSFAPLLVDAGTGALQQLTPGEVIVAFDAVGGR